jgi:hypothetical protein
MFTQAAVRTHLSSNLNRQNPTIGVPFTVFPNSSFAERLKKLRIERGLKQTELILPWCVAGESLDRL